MTMTPKQKKDLLAVIGLGTILVYNGVDIDVEQFEKAKKMLADEFEGDGNKALAYTKKVFDKKLNKVVEGVK